MATTPKTYLSPDEYLKRERRANFKSEYFAGETFAMAGASRRHNQITLDLATVLNPKLTGSGCEVYASDMRVWLPALGLYTYPDIVVACNSEFQDDELDTLLNPLLVVEVLSPSTEEYDTGKKFAEYRTIPSLQEYVTVSQDKPHCVVWRKENTGDWVPTSYNELTSRLLLKSIDATISLAEIYRRAMSL
jgi:Uma2 family endonuclease